MLKTIKKTKTRTKTFTAMFILILAFICLFAGTAAAETISVSDDQEFRLAVETINNNSDIENTIILLNDIEISDSTFTQEDINKAESFGTQDYVIRIDIYKPGTLTIKSDSSTPRVIHSTFSKPNYYPFLNVSGDGVNVVSENIIMDGIGINVRDNYNSILKDFQIKNCNYSGVRVDRTDNLTLENVSVTDCRNGVGGGVYLWYSNVTIKDCNISNNTAVGYGSSDPRPGPTAGQPSGGGIHTLEVNLDICGNTNICNNTVDAYDGNPLGGGIDAGRTYLKIYGNTNILDNTVSGADSAAQTRGGGIAVDFDFSDELVMPGLEIYDSVVISGNKAGHGGGIYMDQGNGYGPYTISISDYVKISDNIAETTDILEANGATPSGGGIFSFEPFEISGNVLIDGNTAVGISTASNGGGLMLQGSPVYISEDVIISKNTADSGGGIFSFAALYIRDNVAIEENHAAANGSGMYIDGYYQLESVISGDVKIQKNTADTAGGGIFATRTAPITISENVFVSENMAPYGGGIFSRNECILNLTEDVVISDNYAIDGGGIYLYNSSTGNILGNVSVLNNTAEGSGGGVYVDESEIFVSGESLVSENVAGNGGGLYVYDGSSVEFSENATVEKNKAVYDSNNDFGGLGGGLCLVVSDATVSGSSGQTVTFNENTASAGGAVFIDGLGDLGNYTLFSKTTDDSNLVFSGNLADFGYLWNLTDSDLSTNMTYIQQNLPEMKNTVFTKPFTNAYNNFDIFFLDEEAVEIIPISIPVQYFADSLSTTPLATEYVNAFTGDELAAEDIAAELGDDWLNLYPPVDYEAGVLQETLPLTVDENTVLNVLYLKGSVPVTVTVKYFADSLTSEPVGTETFETDDGAEITETELVSKLGADWANLHRPAEYKDGALQETLPVTAGSDTVLNILYVKDEIPMAITIEYFTDSFESAPFQTVSFSSIKGMKILESEIISELGENWKNLHQPNGYKSGQLRESFPMTVDENTVLHILYVKNAGGGGTGNATVKDPTPEKPGNQNPDEQEQPENGGGSGGGSDGDHDSGHKPVLVILFFMMAIASYAYVEREESRKDGED